MSIINEKDNSVEKLHKRMMRAQDKLVEKWDTVLNSPAVSEIKNKEIKRVTAQLLENQQASNATMSSNSGLLTAMTESYPVSNVSGNINIWDPILMDIARRQTPHLMAMDVVGVQAMSQPTGLIFAMTRHYGEDPNAPGSEALFDKVNSAWSGNIYNPNAIDPAPKDEGAGGGAGAYGTPDAGLLEDDPFAALYKYGVGMPTAQAEGDLNAKMSFKIDKTTVGVKSRYLRADWSHELQQDLKSVHGLDAPLIISEMLGQEMLLEKNQELMRSIYTVAKPGAQNTTVPGIFDFEGDTDGRWSQEKWHGLAYQISAERSQILKDTRRDRGNIVIMGAHLASQLALAGLIQQPMGGINNYASELDPDLARSTYAGTMDNGRIRVFIDPLIIDADFVIVGYRGPNMFDAGLYYCPYIGSELSVTTVGEDNFQPRMAFKERYGMVQNPWVRDANGVILGQNMALNSNQYYRKFKVVNVPGGI